MPILPCFLAKRVFILPLCVVKKHAQYTKNVNAAEWIFYRINGYFVAFLYRIIFAVILIFPRRLQKPVIERQRQYFRKFVFFVLKVLVAENNKKVVGTKFSHNLSAHPARRTEFGTISVFSSDNRYGFKLGVFEA